MPTPFSHPAAALALMPWFRPIARPVVVITAVILSLVPDIDVLGWRLGISYGAVLGHRGFTHSLLFAALCALVAALVLARWKRVNPFTIWVFFFIVTASHGILDAFTNGGLGVAFFSPFDTTRYRFPWHPIPVAPLSPRELLFSARGWAVIKGELPLVWGPALVLFAAGVIWRWRRPR